MANPKSRNEEILQSIVDDTEYTKVPQSREEYLLLQIKDIIEQGGGGGGGGTSDVQDLILTMDPSTYVITAYLVDGHGNRIGTERTIDIPLETTIVDASYNNVTKTITFTLTSGAYLSVPIGDIIYGLQPLIDSNHKLSSSLVDDSLSRLKFLYTGTAAQYDIDGASLPAGTPVMITDDTDIDGAPTQGSANPVTSNGVYTALNGKVDKIAGKGLSTEDYTTTEKTKLSGIETGANKTVVDSTFSDSSTNPVQNKVVKSALNGKVDKVAGKQLSTEDYTTSEKNKLSGLTNDYSSHTNKPSINSVTLSGNKTSADLGIADSDDFVTITKSAFDNLASKTAKFYFVYPDPVSSLQSFSPNLMPLSPESEPENLSEEVLTDDSDER